MQRQLSGVEPGSGYLSKQIKCMMAQAAQLGVLSNSLSTSLEVRESIRWVPEFAVTTTTGVIPPIDTVGVEVIFKAMALLSLHPKFLYIKTKFSQKLPAFSDLEEANVGAGTSSRSQVVHWRPWLMLKRT
ncbi:hypothetical protein CYMTET_36449 [Cymbomonas tetramitiformis]|uniref:Uncharacterized protein n=1 Tax=Cymbomonas tetramitiformis TaxID=36881 RepID=A0AAE0F7U4_9CHLO|nr:hypothetical protein CYMTET_36449 [Cymbomonas tetramitiformis]